MTILAHSHLLKLAPYTGADLSAAPGKRLIQLAQNESAVPPSPAALDAAAEALKDAALYPNDGSGTLGHAIGEHEHLDPARIMCAAGSMELITLLTRAYLGPGDEAVMSQYGYLFFETSVKMAGASVRRAEEVDLCTNIDNMLATVTPATRMMFLVNPNNPTGSVLAGDQITRLRHSLRDDILLIVDEAYGEFVIDEAYTSSTNLVEETDNTVVLKTFSKVHGLAGLRVGWGYFPSTIVDTLSRMGPDNSLTSVGIAAARAAIADRAHIDAHRRSTHRIRTWLIAQLNDLGLVAYPSQGNFVLVQFSRDAETSAAAAFQHLKSEGIILRGMAPYGLDDCLRITIGPEDDLATMVACLAAWLGQDDIV